LIDSVDLLSDLTVLVITFNEAPNLERTLNSVAWAGKIIVLDSGSTDETVAVASRYPQTTVVCRAFTGFADQCNHGLSLITTPWTLSIDADYVFPSGSRVVIEEAMRGPWVAYIASFEYWVYGQAVRGSILPGRIVLYRTGKGIYEEDGHAHRVGIEGDTSSLAIRIAHDDRKPFSRWCRSQVTYAEQEARKLMSRQYSDLGRNDRVRRMILFAPVLVFLLSYFVRGGFLSGWRGLFYATQRFFAELLLSLFLLDYKIATLSSQNQSNQDLK